MGKYWLIAVAILTLLILPGSASGQTDKEDKKVIDVIIGFKEKPSGYGESLIRSHGGKIKHTYRIINAIAARIPEQAIEAIKKNPRVKYVEPDYEVHALQETLPWGVNRIDADVVWEYGNKGTGVNVCVIDTGIDYTHPDLDDNYRGGYDFVNNDADPMDDNGHGTHCAGIIAAENNDIGVVGVAPEANLYAVKVLDSTGSGWVSDIIAGIEWAVNNDMDIISMSLGTNTYSASLETACNNAYAAGLLLVAAAGNDGNALGIGDTVDYPARFNSVIAVAATNIDDERAVWGLFTASSTGSAVELAAPGDNIYSTYPGGYAALSGTSMACPHVSGTAALIWSTEPELTNEEVRARLNSTADDLGKPGRDKLYGHGLVDADEAVRLVASCDAAGNIKNVFAPGEDVYVKGIGLSPSTSYSVWIQDDPVIEGQTLNTAEDPSGAQELITTDAEGKFGPVLIWSIPSDAPVTHNEYDIVVDKQDANAGIYNSASDGIDSASVVGFIAPVPELPTVALLLIGLLGLAVKYRGWRG